MADDIKNEPVDGGEEATERDRYVVTPILSFWEAEKKIHLSYICTFLNLKFELKVAYVFQDRFNLVYPKLML